MTSHKPGDIYFGEYVRFSTSDKKVGAALAGPDNAVGDIGTIEFILDDSKRQVAWLKNPYGQLVGFLNNHDSYNAAVMAAKGWELHYVLSFTAYSEEPEPGEYWGQVALIAFAPRYAEEFNVFLKAFAKAAGDGLRPDPKLSNDSIVSVLANPAEWKPSSKIKIPRGGGRTAILKDHRSVHDSMLDAARSKKVGCYIVSWAFILAVITLVVWALHKFGLF